MISTDNYASYSERISSLIRLQEAHANRMEGVGLKAAGFQNPGQVRNLITKYSLASYPTNHSPTLPKVILATPKNVRRILALSSIDGWWTIAQGAKACKTCTEALHKWMWKYADFICESRVREGTNGREYRITKEALEKYGKATTRDHRGCLMMMDGTWTIRDLAERFPEIGDRENWKKWLQYNERRGWFKRVGTVRRSGGQPATVVYETVKE